MAHYKKYVFVIVNCTKNISAEPQNKNLNMKFCTIGPLSKICVGIIMSEKC